MKKVINECIFITKNQYIKYYRLFDKPNRVYGKSWNFDNYLSNKNFRPCSYIIYNLQILPYLFDKHNIDCKCDRCLYNIDYPRIRYIFNHYNNPISGHYSNYFNNEIQNLKSLKVIIALGKIAFDNCIKFYKKNYTINKRLIFIHGAKYSLPDGKILIPCYHPSPRNVNTKVINTKKMIHLLKAAKKIL